MNENKTAALTLHDLESNSELVKKEESLKAFLNVPPPEKWIKRHPFVKVKNPATGIKENLPYLPIARIEWLLDRMFLRWRVEVISTAQMFQSVSVVVRVHYFNQVIGEWEFHDGVGAVPIQTDAGKNASDLGAIKSNAVQLALPAAKSYAIKDATEHLGRLFGRDITRADTFGFSEVRNKESNSDKLEKVKELFQEKYSKVDPDDMENFERIISEKEASSYDKAITVLNKL